jgi:hypothetical protein
MKTIMWNLTGALLVTAATLGTGRPQSAPQEIRLSDIRAQQPRETIFASAPCQRVRESKRGWVSQPYKVDPKTLVQDLNTLTEMSDEVILGGPIGSAILMSPSGQSVATYGEVRVIRAWKGPHHAGDSLTFGIPFGMLSCEPPSPHDFTHRFEVSPADFGVPPSFGLPETDSFAYLLFLRQSKGDETKLVQGLWPAAGEGLQGMFLIPVHVPVPPQISAEDYCLGLQGVNVQHCDAIMQTSQSPLVVPYDHDPLAKKYGGMPVSDFLREVQSVTAAQRAAEKSSSK